MINKILSLIIICIIISMSSVSGFDEIYDKKDEYQIKYEETAYFFIFGFIYNLSYKEEMVNETLVKTYTYNCSRALIFIKVPDYRIISFLVKDGFSFTLFEAYFPDAEFYYKGFIGTRFICALQILNITWD